MNAVITENKEYIGGKKEKKYFIEALNSLASKGITFEEILNMCAGLLGCALLNGTDNPEIGLTISDKNYLLKLEEDKGE